MPFENRELPVFVFKSLSSLPFLTHAVFTRHGGFSRGPYASLNLSDTVGDDYQAVSQNLAKVKAFLGTNKLVYATQVHQDKVAIIRVAQGSSRVSNVDALITNQPGVALLIKLADCQGIFLCDVKNKVIAAIHNGWRGSVLNIISKTVKIMEDEFKTHPKDIWAAISPSLGPCCAEFKDYRTLLPKSFWQYKMSGNLFNWWEISCHQLENAGVPRRQIEVAQICTVCNSNFFSYRRDRGKTGRFGVAIMLKEEK